MRDRPVHVAENPAGEHGVEEQGTVVGTDRAWQADANAECPGDDPPPPGELKAIRGQTLEIVKLGTREIYVDYQGKLADSKLKIPSAATGTARNLNTVARLAALAQAKTG